MIPTCRLRRRGWQRSLGSTVRWPSWRCGIGPSWRWNGRLPNSPRWPGTTIPNCRPWPWQNCPHSSSSASRSGIPCLISAPTTKMPTAPAASWSCAPAPAATRRRCLCATSMRCIAATARSRAGKSRCSTPAARSWAVSRRWCWASPGNRSTGGCSTRAAAIACSGFLIRKPRDGSTPPRRPSPSSRSQRMWRCRSHPTNTAKICSAPAAPVGSMSIRPPRRFA